MANIIIPSKDIYNLSYSPVVDNAINRIEVSSSNQKEIVENNTVFSENFENPNITYVTDPDSSLTSIKTSYSEFSYKYGGSIDDRAIAVAGFASKTKTFFIEVPASTAHYVINNEKVTATIGARTFKLYKGNAYISYYLASQSSSNPTFPKTDNFTMWYDYDFDKKEAVYTVVDSIPTSVTAEYDGKKATYNARGIAVTGECSVGEKQSNGNYKIAVSVLMGGILIKGGVEQLSTGSGKVIPVEFEDYRCNSDMTITLDGKTFSLQSEDEVIISDSGKDGDLFSLPSNDLFQSKYKNQINSNISKVLNEYSNGKEICTILCKVGEYYDERGDLVISTKNTNKMLFEMYDKVIPHTYNQNGVDEPLSHSTKGEPKVFTVLSVNEIFDGAVWQELTLQEAGVQVLEQLASPTIYISGNYLYITDNSGGGAKSYDIYANSKFLVNTTNESFDLSSIEFENGTNTIYVIAKGLGYYDSDQSVSKTYIVTLKAPTISLDGELLTITDNSNKAESFGIYVNGVSVKTIYGNSFDVSQIKFTESINEITVKAFARGYNSSNFSNPVYYNISKATSPTISIDGTMLTIVDESNTATAFIIYANDTYVATISEKEYDLSRIALKNGTYSIAVKASAPTLATSDFSNEVSYIVYRESSWVEENGKTVYYLKMNDLKLGDNYIRGEDFVLTILDILESEQYGNRVYTPIYIRSSSNIADIQFTSSIPLGSESLGDIEYEGNRAYVTYNGEELAYGTYEIIEELKQQSTCRFIPMEPYNELTLWIKYLSGERYVNSYIPNDSADKINLVIST
jgi:hypothetical protein